MSVGARGAQGRAKHSTAEKVARASRATVVSAIQVWEREEGSVWCGNGRCWCHVPCAGNRRWGREVKGRAHVGHWRGQPHGLSGSCTFLSREVGRCECF